MPMVAACDPTETDKSHVYSYSECLFLLSGKISSEWAFIEDARTKITTDHGKLKQIITNLLSNAIMYTAKGRVCLRFANCDSDHWVIAVEDTGVGFAPEDCESIFGEFHRSPKTTELRGAGLGLPVTRHLVHLLGGAITVQTEVDQGSRFEVRLPSHLRTPSHPK